MDNILGEIAKYLAVFIGGNLFAVLVFIFRSSNDITSMKKDISSVKTTVGKLETTIGQMQANPTFCTQHNTTCSNITRVETEQKELDRRITAVEQKI